MSFDELSKQITTLFKNISAGKKITLLALVGGTIIALITLITWAGKADFQVLYSNLSPEDAGAILTKLKDQKVPYQISSNGSSILIPRERVYETRLDLASQGLPQGSGVGFEIFDNTKLGMTEFVQNVNYQRALQGELSRTINGFAEVESSRVHIVLPEKSLFVEEDKPAMASVVLKLRPGRILKRNQVQGIVHLISSSVSGLLPENVTILDNYGKLLAGPNDGQSIAGVSYEKLEYQEKVERGLEKRIETMLEKALGPGKAIARVSCIFDFRKIEKTEENYSPDKSVIRSEQVLKETSRKGNLIPSGIPGVASNIGTGTATVAPNKTNVTGANPAFSKEDRTVNYEISKVISHTVEPVGDIKKISVAVLVDGTYKVKQAKKGAKGSENWEYIPRSQEEMAKIESIVKRAINYDEKRGDALEVVNISFETSKAKLGKREEKIEEQGWLSKLVHDTPFVRYCFAGILVLLALLFVVRPLVKWLTNTPISETEMLKQLPMTVKEIESSNTSQQLPLRDLALQMLAGDTDSAIKAMRDEWMSGNQT